MEVEIYLENGDIAKKKVSIGCAIEYGRNKDDIIERYSFNKVNSKEKFISDKSLEDILKTNYFKYGIIPRDLFIDLNDDQKSLFYILTKIDKNLLGNLNIINTPNDLINQINNLIDYCHTYLDLIHKNYEILSALENLLCNKIDNYRNQFNNIGSYTYFDKVLYFNRIRNFINEIKHEKFMDFQYFYTNLLKFKYFTLIKEENIMMIQEQFLVFNDLYNTCHQSIEFLDENNEKKNYEIKNGSIKIDEIINLLQSYVELF